MADRLFDIGPDATPHPAKFSGVLLPVIAGHLVGYHQVLDPMAGVGTLARHLQPLGHWVWSNELEPEWEEQCPRPRSCYDARHLTDIFFANRFDAIATSPTYGNRMADHHEARDTSRRNTYTHTLGRKLTPGNTGAMQWGDKYRRTHEQVIAECVRVLRPGGRVVWNVKDHIRGGRQVHVAAWHCIAWKRAGFTLAAEVPVPCPGNRHGQNGQLRVDHEWVLVFDKPEAS